MKLGMSGDDERYAKRLSPLVWSRSRHAWAAGRHQYGAHKRGERCMGHGAPLSWSERQRVASRIRAGSDYPAFVTSGVDGACRGYRPIAGNGGASSCSERGGYLEWSCRPVLRFGGELAVRRQ